MKRARAREITAAERDKQLENVSSIGFRILVGKSPGPYVPRTPVLHAWRDFHTRLDDVGPRIRPEELVDKERDFDPTPVPPPSETRISKIERGRTRHLICAICRAPFTARNNEQKTCSRVCGTEFRAQKRLGTALADQKARVRALRCSPTTPTASGSAAPPSASPAAPSADTPAQAAAASES